MLLKKRSIVLQTTDGQNDGKLQKYKFSDRIKKLRFLFRKFGFKKSAN